MFGEYSKYIERTDRDNTIPKTPQEQLWFKYEVWKAISINLRAEEDHHTVVARVAKSIVEIMEEALNEGGPESGIEDSTRSWIRSTSCVSSLLALKTTLSKHTKAWSG